MCLVTWALISQLYTLFVKYVSTLSDQPREIDAPEYEDSVF